MESFKQFFDSKTVKPNFKNVHLILTLFLFEEHTKGFGRYKLEEELLITSGMAKSIFNKLKNKMIKKLSQRKGHTLNANGKKVLEKIKENLICIKKGDKILSDIAIGNNFYFAQIKNVINRLTNGIAQRNGAVKIKDLVNNFKIKIDEKEGIVKIINVGATCLVYENDKLRFPRYLSDSYKEAEYILSEEIKQYFYKQINLKNEDVIVIGGSKIEIIRNFTNEEKQEIEEKVARLATMNSALSFFNLD